jgi:DNA adenine methylase
MTDNQMTIFDVPGVSHESILTLAIHKKALTRGGIATEKIWMNYDISEMDLATTEFVGVDYIDRQRIKRKIKLLVKRLKNTPRHERQALLEAIQKHL